MDKESKLYKEKLSLAKLAYKEMMQVIKKYEDMNLGICMYWDECISVDEFFFQWHELSEK